MAYVDYTFYTNTFKGAIIPSESFDNIEHKAELYLNKETYGNIKADTTITDSIKSCTCEIAEFIYKNSNDFKNVSSERVGDYSVSYVSQADNEKAYNSRIKQIVRLWLNNSDDIGLLYSGVV